MMGTLFIFWGIGVLLAFIFFNSEGETNWNKYPPQYVSKYTYDQQVVYSLTWFIWFIRFWIRAIIWMVMGISHWLWDAAISIWVKWRDE